MSNKGHDWGKSKTHPTLPSLTKKAEKMETWDDGLTHVHLDVFSISLMRTDEGVVVDIWEKGFESSEPVASTYAFTSEVTGEER